MIQKKDYRITIRIDKNLSDKLNRVSLRDKISVGELCRNLINGGLKNENENKKHKKFDRQENL